MPSPAWREAFSTMWTNTDSVAKGVVEDAIRAGKSDCANYWSVYNIPMKWSYCWPMSQLGLVSLITVYSRLGGI
jgi:hypothetical protein